MASAFFEGAVDTVITLAVLGVFVGLLYNRNAEKQPEKLTLGTDMDVRRWRHDGTQPLTDRVGNHMPPGPLWHEVKYLIG